MQDDVNWIQALVSLVFPSLPTPSAFRGCAAGESLSCRVFVLRHLIPVDDAPSRTSRISCLLSLSSCVPWMTRSGSARSSTPQSPTGWVHALGAST